YRYFETIPGAAVKVNYPFGYGLSYTSFEWNAASVSEDKGIITVDVNVTNTGSCAGKEVMELYVSAPYGTLGKATKSLVAFEKTRLLEPGETQRIRLIFNIYDLASYDDLGKIRKSSYVLEAGDYCLYLGNSVRNVNKLDFIYNIPETRIVKQLSARLVPTSLKERMTADGSFEALPMSEPNDPDYSEFKKLLPEESDGFTPEVRHQQGYCLWRHAYKNNARPFIEVAEGRMTLDEFMSQLSDEDLANLLGGQPNTSTANTFGIGNMPEYGIPSIMTADGPAGLRIQPECGVNTTAFPCATLLACTWNRDMVYRVGEAGAEEVKENNIAMWLTPAVNIHRSPLCGRNFEYYSEDPFLAGTLAAQMVKGIQSQHISASVKHFACNNKETNRKNCDSRVSERAVREIYLKAFEIIVKEAKPWCIMSSYNIINGHRASECADLLTGILRDEWGYEGLVTTDWWAEGEHYKEVKAGNDVKMPCGYTGRLMEAVAAGLLGRRELESCAKRVLELILKVD
ncbi:MAG: glycoside hydrolase family 3 N-terminal domain-containing protein, partial [Lachnospiraceae bacterium]